MRYPPPPAKLFVRNRARLRRSLPKGALVLVQANDVMPTNADGTLGFKQNADLLWLSGIDQEETILVLFPDAPNPRHREILFVRETSERIAIWEGQKLTQEETTQRSGIATVMWTKDFEGLLPDLLFQAQSVYLTTNEHPRAARGVQTRNDRFIQRLRQEYPLHRLERLAPLLHPLRYVKDKAEVDLITEACRITGHGFERVLEFLRPGVGEWEIEAELVHEFTRRRSRGFAYPPIIGAGANGCALHYVDNHSVCQDGEMVLLDVAAEWSGWTSDLTRTVPVNGRFTPRQRAVYNAVLRVLRGIERYLRPGRQPQDVQRRTVELMEKELIGLGLIKAAEARKQGPDKPLVKKYFMHGVGHPLGLDVHDVYVPGAPIQAGAVYTIEPGIYIREENLAVRLEDTYWVGPKRNVNLMAHIPIEAADIEARMARARKARR
jgi:Xaa-Pro aminopeptidase